MLDPTGGIVTSAVAAKATQTIVKSSLIATVWDSVVDFAVDQAKSHGKNEFTKRIEGLRSDTRLRKQIQTALERAVIRSLGGRLTRHRTRFGRGPKHNIRRPPLRPNRHPHHRPQPI
ncbi:hypothetical protein KFU94_00710 [Chloroflexi bacterium TSY]|nr:hypothetical protein [Chloroflexi bacterium TSY]